MQDGELKSSYKGPEGESWQQEKWTLNNEVKLTRPVTNHTNKIPLGF